MTAVACRGLVAWYRVAAALLQTLSPLNRLNLLQRLRLCPPTEWSRVLITPSLRHLSKCLYPLLDQGTLWVAVAASRVACLRHPRPNSNGLP